MERDFTLMRELGANTFRTFTVPPRWLLDLAGEYGLRAIIGIPWAEHVAFLDSPRLQRDIRHTIADGAASCRGHAAVLGVSGWQRDPARYCPLAWPRESPCVSGRASGNGKID